MARGKPKKDKYCANKTRTSPRKQLSATGGADAEEEKSQEQSQKQSQQRDELAEGDGGVPAGDGEKTEKQSVLCGQQNKMNKSQPSLRNTSCFMIWRMLIIKTRRNEKICYWSSPGPCSQVVSGKCNFSLNVIFRKIFSMNLLHNFVNIWAC